MDTKKIGEYLRRLRQRAGYTQADLGLFINVTDKAISRWESGVGTPEISNLLMLSKLYRVTVDDILNCNENVFAEQTETVCPTAAAEAHGSGAPAQQDVAAPPDGGRQFDAPSGNPSRPPETEADGRHGKPRNTVCGKSRTFDDPAHKFLTVLFFAFLTLGAPILTLQKPDLNVDLALTTPYVIFAVLTVAAAILYCLRTVIPQRGYRITMIAATSCFIVNEAMLFILQMFVCLNLVMPISFALGNIALLLIFAMQLLYQLYEFVNSERGKKILNTAAFIVGLITASFGVVFCFSHIGLPNSYPEFWSRVWSVVLGTLVASLAAAVFAVGQKFTKWVQTGFAGLCLVAIPLYIPLFAFGTIAFRDSVFSFPSGSDPAYLLTVAMGAPMFTAAAWFCPDRRRGIFARIAAGLSVACLIPLIVYTFDILIANAIFDSNIAQNHLSTPVYVRLFVLAATIAKYVKDFRFGDLFRRRKKEALHEA